MDSKPNLPNFIRVTDGEDLLEGKSQERISTSLSELINDDTHSQKLIGLEGPWGAGKSNLISILKSKLRQSHYLYIHDAWGHQEDLQRRAFLEELTENLCKEGLLDKKIWSNKLSDLLARKQVTTTTVTPQLSMGIILAVLLALINPIFKLLTDNVSDLYWKFWIALLPFLGFGFFWARQSDKQTNKTGNKRWLRMNELFYLYKEKELENKTRTLTFDEEPSVRQFRNWMNDLSSDLTKKLIVVFDNMDRLPPGKVQALWSSINTFYSDNSFDNIWVIVPFDRDHINDAFNDSGKSNGDQFISKTFGVVYKVGKPVLTDWHKFFKLKYNEAFGESEEDDFIHVRTVFDLTQNAITPRTIISFINEIVTIKRIVLNEIDLRYIALYVLKRTQIEADPVNNILSLDFVKPCNRLFADTLKVQENVAALIYNVPVTSASQVILQREIQITIRDENTNRFIELSKHVHFLDILEKMNVEGQLDIIKQIELLAELPAEFLKNENLSIQFQRIWTRLNNDMIEDIPVDMAFTKASEVILKAGNSVVRDLHLKYLINGWKNNKDFDGKLYFRAMRDVEAYITKEKLSMNFSAYIHDFTIQPNNYISYINEGHFNYQKYKVRTLEKPLNDYLIEETDGGAYFDKKIAVIKAEYDFTEILDHLKTTIKSDNVVIENCENIYSLYKSLTNSKPIPLISDIKIDSFFEDLSEDSEMYYDLIAMRVVRGSNFSIRNSTLENLLATPSIKLIEKIYPIVEYYKSLGGMLKMSGINNNPLLTGILQQLVGTSVGVSSMSIETILPQFKFICIEFKLSPIRFITRLNGWIKFAKEEINKDNVADIVPDVEFYSNAIDVNNELTKYIIDVFKQSLKSITKEEWKSNILNQNFHYKVLYLLLEGNKVKVVPSKFVEGFKEILIEYARGEVEPGDVVQWVHLLNKVDLTKFKQISKNIRDEFINSGNITPDKFIFFFDLLIEHGDLTERSADVTRRIFSMVLNDSVSVNLLLNNRVMIAPLVIEAKEDGQEFREFLKRQRSKAAKEFVELTGGRIAPKRKKRK